MKTIEDLEDLFEYAESIESKERIEKSLNDYNKERSKYTKKGGNVFTGGVKICKLSPYYDNNIAIKNIMKQSGKAEMLAERKEESMSTAQRHAEFVFGQIFNL